MEQYAGAFATTAAAILVFLATMAGLWLKRRQDRLDLAERARQAKAAEEAVRQQANYDQTQEDLAAAREEARKLRVEMTDNTTRYRADMDAADTRYRSEMAALWRQLAEMRDALNQADSHIADLERYINEGGKPPAPMRRKPS